MSEPLSAKIFEAFTPDIRATPLLSLRGGNTLDEYREPEALDPAIDIVSDDYLEHYWWGIAFLDPHSWRHYLPYLIEFSLRNKHEHSLVVDALLTSLRPPDRQPPRLASLSAAQESVVAAFLDVMAFDEGSVHQTLARTALEEWWAPGALFRPGNAGAADVPDRMP